MTPLDNALAAIDDYLAVHSAPDSLIHRARVRAMVRAYHQYWADDNKRYTVVNVEQLLLGDIHNLRTGKVSEYKAGGKLDVRLIETSTNSVGIMDHKFLSGELDENRVLHLSIDTQPLQYAYLELLAGNKADFALWDVITKTSHKPCKAGKTRKTEETFEEFEERVLGVYLEAPKKYFHRRRIPIMRDNLADSVQELYDWTKMLDSSVRSGVALRNTGACFEFNKPCKYLSICTGTSSQDDPVTWKKAQQVHAELELPKEINPSLVITNSRLKCFKSCPRKHYYQYVLGLKRAKEQIDEPLFVGSLGHVALEHMWASFGKN